MKRISLDPLVERAKEREEAATRALAESNGRLARQEQQLQELHRYADEYAPPSTGVLSASALQNRMAFRDRLQEAAGEQARAIEQGRSACERDRQRLARAGQDTRALEKLQERRRIEESREQTRAENRRLDEFAARSHAASRDETP